MLRDMHCHACYGMPAQETVDYFLRLKEENQVDKINILSAPIIKEGGYFRLQNLHILQLKDMLYPYAFAYMGMWHEDGKKDYLKQLHDGIAQGFEGLKILEGKPDRQMQTGVRIWKPEFDEMFDYAEEQGIPVLMHVGDPAKFWDRSQATEYMLSRGWCYDGPGFLSLEELYEDVWKLLDKHPKLRLTLAHFFFMSDNLKRAAEFLDAHPSVCFDITPGTEMYENFSNNWEASREFFMKYADRIYLGTDVNDFGQENYANHCGLYHTTREFMRGTEGFTWRNVECKPFGLSADIADKITWQNFMKVLGDDPKPVNYEKVLEELDAIEAVKNTLCEKDLAEYDRVNAYFRSKAAE